MQKKAVSELVAYVLLISLSIGLSIAVYTWLKGYASEHPTKTCPDGVSLIIQDYLCEHENITMNLSNKGLFKIDGYIFRINNETEGDKPRGLPVNLIEVVTLPGPLNPGEVTQRSWNYSGSFWIVEMEIEPFRLEGNTKILCSNAVIRQRTKLDECLQEF